ncbi:MAG: metallophosphoesterase family protein [Paludibacter sp.]
MATKLKISLFVLIVFGITGCNSNLDFSGFLYSPDHVDSRFEESDAWNQTHPFKTLTVNSENYQILVSGDSHIGGLINFRKMLDEAKKPENLAFVMVGDNVTGKKEDYLRFKNELPDFNQIPYFLVVGNHDLYFDGWKTFYEYFGSSTYYFTVQTPLNRDIYICLDSGGGTLGDKQLTWLKNLLSTKRDQYRNCVVFTHVNFFRDHHTGSTNPLETELEVLLPLFAQNRVNLVIMGHDHNRAIDKLGWTTYITMDALLDGFPNASFVKLEVTKTTLGYEFQDIK